MDAVRFWIVESLFSWDGQLPTSVSIVTGLRLADRVGCSTISKLSRMSGKIIVSKDMLSMCIRKANQTTLLVSRPPVFIFAVSTEPVPELDLTTLKSRHRQMRMRTCNLTGLSLNGYVIRSHPLHVAQRPLASQSEKGLSRY